MKILPPVKPMHDLIIEAGHTDREYWRDIWRFRGLLYFLAWRDVLVRYKQTAVGVAWAIVRPVLTMLVLTAIFNRVAHLKSAGVPYSILVLSGMLPWQFFATALAESGNSVVGNAGMISKVYFPRLLVPASSVITSLVDFMISALLLGIMMAWYRVVPGPAIFALPLFIALVIAAAFGGGLWLSAMMVRYRDVRFIVPFIVQFGLYISPVGFSSGFVPAQWRLLYSLNPMVSAIEGFRWALFGGEHTIYMPGLIISALSVAMLLVSGVLYFRRTERAFADII